MPVEIWRPPLTATFMLGDLDVELIPLGPRHREVLAEAFGRLSDQTRYFRFMAPVPTLSDAALTYLTALDMVDHFAWGVLVEGEPAAVGRYARIADNPSAAEIAITVVDDLQGRGLGQLLIQALAVVAASAGVSTFEFEVLAENRPMLGILRMLGATTGVDAGVVHADLAVGSIPAPPVASELLMDVVEAARAAT